ncbi:MAG: spore cortex-lytic enzyme [Clostridia bacterium]|nr:spore cortex-lytic enzyme [Clostridia bacterium]
MKRLKICLVAFAVFACLFAFGTSVYTKTQMVEPVATTIESVDAAVADTKEVQKVLKKWGYYTGSVDGINGPLTKTAVKKFQRKYGLTADGIVGPLTASKMGLRVKGGTASSSYNNNDLYLLAKLVHSEARGESYTGQVAVAAVVLNRVDDSRFPNTIAGVIYQPWAFTAINDGQFNLEPNNTAYQAAKDAMNGWDPTYGAVYYYNPKTATSAWIRSTKTVTVIGQHVFSV